MRLTPGWRTFSTGACLPLRGWRFERHGRAFWLRWVDKGKAPHSAYYTGAGGRPVLQVDKTWIDLTMAEVIHFGLHEEK